MSANTPDARPSDEMPCEGHRSRHVRLDRGSRAPRRRQPEIADDEVLIRVHAAGVDRGVRHIMTGLPYPIRLAGFGLRAPKNPVRGMDVAGVVEAVGKDVTRFQPGDEVFGIGKGSFAEYARAPENKLAAKPANLTFEQAAAVAISGSTALQACATTDRSSRGRRC